MFMRSSAESPRARLLAAASQLDAAPGSKSGQNNRKPGKDPNRATCLTSSFILPEATPEPLPSGSANASLSFWVIRRVSLPLCWSCSAWLQRLPFIQILPIPTAADTLHRLCWDTAVSYADPVLRMLRDIVGLDQVLFGSDFPYLRRDLAVNCVQRLERIVELTADERTRVLSGNAVKLFPRFDR